MEKLFTLEALNMKIVLLIKLNREEKSTWQEQRRLLITTKS